MWYEVHSPTDNVSRFVMSFNVDYRHEVMGMSFIREVGDMFKANSKNVVFSKIALEGLGDRDFGFALR